MNLDWKHFTLNTFTDPRGSLTPVELTDFIDFEVKRMYTVHHNFQRRGGHAHLIEREFFMLASGTCTAKIHDGAKWHEIEMKANLDALYIGGNVWHEFDEFSKGGVLVALSSTVYNPDRLDYIEDFDLFMSQFSNKS
ncbi:hypothetical protein COV81_02640 [Candidatus Peregrinibacteria bacterium CG11_big_fil_rev_8_21_14_0_20_41_10]|nr:MAG: hypothetical protein COV81_02640 [Candidatus Peregrinibacteria bacterium CG11_big_fil_rev_8_21_14_0_20_41_10]PIZ75807.1 MAG: hypothetical protein COY06_02700 [Candidatus Peregrinibacteria bacterium CG_4_10_14_0_2_um_filter_41_8]PJC38264.1 MAG: hypothetical protein CO045_01225 [Candidatus Peregrinibacteria bacterium CG_4_9_14_0_2_um_filter_41_14]